MYSRKYIHSLPTATPITQAAGSASPEYGHPTPPPDYAGIAFRGSAERSAQDFPETVIPLTDSAAMAGESDMSAPTDMPPESAVPRSDGDEAIFEDESDEPTEVDRGEGLYEGENETSLPEQAGMPEGVPAPALKAPSEDGEAALDSPLKWLKELKMEDLLLLWLLLMLLYGESNDEIELLLGLLLFASR